MLMEQIAIMDSLGTDTIPLGFISTEDGRVLLAVAVRENGVLKIMAAPVALMPQNNPMSPFIKTTDGNLILHPPLVQISLEDIMETGIQQAALLPIPTLPTAFGQAELSDDVDTRLVLGNSSQYPFSAGNYAAVNNKGQMTQNEHTQPPVELKIPVVERSIHKRSPGRPRKIGATKSARSMKCDICRQEFTKQSLYRKHMEHHAEEKPHRCPKCPASFNIPTNFTLHMATHNTGEPKCPECGRKYARMASLKSHMLLHAKEENLFCTECEDAFSTKAQLDAHLKLHGEKWSTEDVRKCKLCNKQFVQPALYRLHIREHYRLQTKIVKQTKRGAKHKTVYKCTICLKSFQKPSQLMRHIRVHTGEKPFKCTVCGRAFTQKSSLQIHMWQHNGIRPHTCNLCNAKFSQKGNLNAHILRAHNAPEGEPIYGCTYCTCVFKKLGSLNGHIKRMHSNPTTAESSAETTTTASATACTTESSTITLKTEEVPPRFDDAEADMRNTVDNVMSQLASLESTVNSSVNSSESTAAARDDILQQALKNSGLPSKIKNSSDDVTEPKKAEARTTYVTLLDRAPDGSMRKYVTIKQRCIGNIRWYSCSFCHKEFKKPSDLIRHLRVHTQEKPYKCSYCFRSFALKSTMIAHERTHTGAKKYTCGSCDKTFACHSSLTAHARLHAKPHKCNICGKSFGASAILKGHMKLHAKPKSKISPEAESLIPQVVLQEPLVISDVGNKISVAQVQSKQKQIYENADVARPHKCWVCHAAFRKISHLKQHYRRHTGERPYKCTKCDRRFTSNSVLKSHLHTHDDLRPYSCPVCNTKFSTQSSMKRHLVTHSNKRPYMCPYCQKTFKTYVNCRKHMKIHKHELAQRQLDQQKTQEQTAEMEIAEEKSEQVIPENLSLSEDMEVSFQPQMAPDFSQVFSEQFQTITEDREKYLPSDNVAQTVVNQSMSEMDANNLTASQTLHADESGTITLPNYTGDQTLTPESIREIEETLNQQLFNIGMNFGLGNNLSKQIDDTNAAPLDNSRQQPVLNIIYENNKGLESSGNTIFPSQFESFDISQIGLQTDNEIDMLNTGNTTNMASILPRSIQEEQRLIPMTTTADKNPVKTNMHLSMNTKQPCPDLLSLLQASPKYPKIAAKADTTNNLIQKVNSEIKIESNMEIVANRNERNSLSFTENFQDTIHLNQQTTLHALPSQPPNIDSSAVNVPQCESLLQCHMCSKQGFTTAGLKEHLKTHRGAKEYQCTECSLRFCTNGGLSRHLKMHTNKQQWKCSVCQKVFGSKLDLKYHDKEHEGNCYPNSVEPDSSQNESVSLDTSLPSIQSLDLRMNADSSISEKVLLDTVAEKEIMDRLHEQVEKKEKKEYINKCKYCPKTFRKPSDLTRHIRTHTGEKPYKCDYCHKSFAVKCTLDSHTKVHTGKKTFCCHVCNSFFATKGSLKVHMRLHTGSKPFRCLICDLRFRTSGHRKVHLLKHVREHKGSAKRKHKHLKIAAVAEVVASLEKSIENVEQPVTTATAINNNNSVTQTMEFPNLDAINIDQTINASGMSNHITFNADGTIMNNNSLLSINESNQLVANLHFLLANGLVTIQADDTLIPQTASSDAGVVQDEPRMGELMSSNALQVPCDNTNTNHIVITPVNPPPVVTAPQEPTTTIQLSNGMVMQMAPSEKLERMGKQIVKTQSKKECDICGKTFMKPYQVERHKRIHTGERPFNCNLCPKSFAQKSTLQMHQKHHTGDRPHPCPHCEYSFTQKGNLQTHLRRVHQLDALEIKKLKKGQQLSAKPTQEGTGDTKILNLDEISIVEFLK